MYDCRFLGVRVRVHRCNISELERMQEELMVPVAFEENEGKSLICLDGNIDIASAMELKILLQEALASGKQVRVRLESATELHVTALQLLYAAEREAAVKGIRLTLDGLVPDFISVSMADDGFSKFQFES